MDREEVIEQYLAAWSKKDVPGLLKLMHPQASYYDAFWGEVCSGSDLSDYLENSFEYDAYTYKPDDELISTPNGLIVRYVAFEQNDTEEFVPIFNGAEVFTFSGDVIMTISDHYCDPNRIDLVEIASLAERQHSRAHIAPLGLSAKISSRIKHRLQTLATDMQTFLDPALTVAQLADHVGCSVMHLFHVLEEELESSFLQFAFECRARYAATLMAKMSSSHIEFDQIAKQSGFETVAEFQNAFQLTFGQSAAEYLQKSTERSN